MSLWCRRRTGRSFSLPDQIHWVTSGPVPEIKAGEVVRVSILYLEATNLIKTGNVKEILTQSVLKKGQTYLGRGEMTLTQLNYTSAANLR